MRCGTVQSDVWAPVSRAVKGADSGRGQLAQGIDVSHYQEAVDWQPVQEAGVIFALLTATEGATGADERFDQNWAGAARLGSHRI